MKRLFLSFLLPLLLVCQAQAQVPKIITGKPGRLIVIDSGAKAEVVWHVDRNLRDPGSHYKDLAQKRLVVVAPPGTYEVLCLEKGTDTFLEFMIVVEGTPPGPQPPVPIDTLVVKLTVAYEADKAAGRATDKDKSKLAKVYQELQQYVDTPLIKTVYDASEVRKATIKAIIGQQLPQTVKVIDDYLAEKIPEPQAEEAKKIDLTVALRQRYKECFAEIAKALGGESPTPDTPLVLALKAAFAKEVATDRVQVAILADACRKASDKAGDQSLMTVKQVNDFFVANLKSRVGQNCPNLRAAITEYLNSKLPRTVSATLDAQTRADIVAAFNDIVKGLAVLQ